MKQFHQTILLVLFSVLSLFARAQWSAVPETDNNLFATVYNPLTFCTDGHGGAYFTWSQTFNGQDKFVLFNRIDSAGYLRYGDSGIVLRHFASAGGQPGAPVICEDGAGGCYIVYSHSGLLHQPLLCHHIGADGTQVWADTGRRVSDNTASQLYTDAPQVVNAGGAGVMIVYNLNSSTGGLIAQRLDFNGNRLWGATGKIIMEGTDMRDPHIIPDGNAGFGVVWTDVSYEHDGFANAIRFACYDGNGNSRIGGIGSVKINQQGDIAIGSPARLMLTAAKNFILFWEDHGLGGRRISARKIQPNGSFLWDNHEVIVRDTTGEVRTFDCLTDGAEGAYITWVDGRKVGIGFGQYIQHIRGDSTKAWAAQGIGIDTNSLSSYNCLAPDINGRIKLIYEVSPEHRVHLQLIDSLGHKLLADRGQQVSTPARDLLSTGSVLPVANNHAIVFLKGGGGASFAKYIPFGLTVPLPVHFLSFTASDQGVYNQLNWQTENEEQVSEFTLERSTDGSNYVSVASVSPSNTPGIHNYTYSDSGQWQSTVYYRIRETDIDGAFTYSTVATITVQGMGELMISPNPVHDLLKIRYSLTTVTGSVIISDLNGRRLQQSKLAAQQGTIQVSTVGWPAGIYVCQVIDGGNVQSRKILVVR